MPLSDTELGIQRRFLARCAALKAAAVCVGGAPRRPCAVSCATPLGISFEMRGPDTAVSAVAPESAAAEASRGRIAAGHLVLLINGSDCVGDRALLEVRMRPPEFVHALVLGVPPAWHRVSKRRALQGMGYAVWLYQYLEQRTGGWHGRT